MRSEEATVVLVHGAWADGSSWGSVIAALKAQGIKAVAAPLPLTSLADDVAAVGRRLARIDTPVVLVGHAYAGAVIGETHSEKIKSLVYVAALAPDEGETVAKTNMIVAETQRFMAARMKAHIRAHPVDHTPSITAPALVVDIINEAIRDAS